MLRSNRGEKNTDSIIKKLFMDTKCRRVQHNGTELITNRLVIRVNTNTFKAALKSMYTKWQ